MNMISTGAFLNEMDASNKQPTLAEKFAAVWEKKNAKAARAGGVSLMALSLAACGGSSSTTTTTSSNAGVTPIDSDLTNGSDNFTGTAGDDTITAGAVYTPGGNDRINSLQDEDVISGGAGDDTINITVTTANDNGNNIITPTMTSVENVNVNFANSGATDELDFQDVTGVVDLALTRISTDGTATIDNIQDVIATLTLSDSGEDTDAIVISFDDNVLAGTADSLAATVSGVDVASLEIDGEDGEGYETINMAATGDIVSDDNLIDGTETLNITGAGDATLGGFSLSAGHLATINASGSTGNMDIELGDDNIVEARIDGGSGADIDFTYTGSAGNDYIRVDDESLSAAPTGGDDDNGHDTIDGGAGDNTLDFTVDTGGDLIHNDVTVSNIQDVHIDVTAAVTATLDGQQFGEATGSADLDTVTVRNNNAATNTVATFEIDELDANVLVRIQHASTDGNNDESENILNVHQADGTGTADSQTVEIISGTGNTDEVFDFRLAIQADDADNTITADDEAVESVTIIDSDTENNTVNLTTVAEHTTEVKLTGGRADDTFTVTGAIIAEKVDASGQLSDTTIEVGTADQDITMGSGDDTILFDAADDLDENDVDVDGGAGDDMIIATFTADPADDLDITRVETLRTAVDANVTVDVTNSDDIATVSLMSNAIAAATNPLQGAQLVTDILTLEADGISTVELFGNTADAAGTEVFNGLTISAFEANSPAALTISLNNIGNDAANVGVITLDADATSLTIASANDDNTRATTFQEISATGLTSLTVTDGIADADLVATRETVIDLDNTTALATVDATGANGGVNLSIDGLADSATINLVQSDDEGNDARDDLTITFVGDTGADNVTITGGDNREDITITNGDMDNLIINSGGGVDNITTTGMTGNNVEYNTGAGDDVVTNGAADEEINMGAGDDTINVTTVFIANDEINGGTGTDTLNVTDAAALDFTSIAVVGVEAITFAADGGTDAIVFDSSDLAVSAITLTLTGAADGDDDTIRIENGGTVFEAAAEAAAADVDIAGEWHLENGNAPNGVLTIYNEVLDAVTTITLAGLDGGAVAIDANDILWTA